MSIILPFTLFCSLSFLPRYNMLNLVEKAALLQPLRYDLYFYFKANVTNASFNYSLTSAVHFKLAQEVDVLVLETRASQVNIINVTFGPDYDMVSTQFERYEYFFVLLLKNGSNFVPGYYRIEAVLFDDISPYPGHGIHYALQMDRFTKDWTYSIFANFLPSFARHVILCCHNTNAPTPIKIYILHYKGFHAFFVKQPLTQSYWYSLAESPEFHRRISDLELSLPEPLVQFEMYEIIMPVGFVSLYITQNVRMTNGAENYSATVTVGRNQKGQFSEEYRYILDIFYKYVRKYKRFASLPLRFEDVFLHLQQNKTRDIEVEHTTCYISMPYVLQFPKNIASLNSFLARCLASNHIMSHRYPQHWSDYYILVGLKEYYAKMLRLDGGGLPAPNDYSGIETSTVLSFAKDDFQRYRPIMGGYSENPAYYNYLNQDRALCFLNMLKHLVEGDKGETFHSIASQFLSEDWIFYNRSSFMSAYQKVTEYKVFASDNRIEAFFDSWTKQHGYPILKVTRTGHILNIIQLLIPWYSNITRFIIPISVVVEPRAYQDRNKTQPDLWLLPKDDEATYDIRGVSKWFLVNNQRTGYYRVLYDEWNYKLLRFELLRGDLTKISPVTRGQTVDDVLFMAKLGLVQYDIAFEMLEYLQQETNDLPWNVVGYELEVIALHLRFTSTYPMFRHFMKIVSRRFYNAKVEESENLSKHALRWACWAGLNHCLKYTNKLFLAFLRNRATFQDLDRVICEGVRSVDADTYTYIKLALYNEYRGSEQDLYLTALICVDNYDYLIETLNVLLRRTSEIAAWLPATEKARQISRMCQKSPAGAKAVLDFAFQHPNLMKENIGSLRLVEVLATLSKSLYKRSHERKVRLIILYLGLKDTRKIFSNISGKRRWLERFLLIVTKVLDNFQGVQVLEEYTPIIH